MLANDMETRDLSNNPQLQAVIAALSQRWGQQEGTIREEATVREVALAVKAL
jgi:hypothetical protein